MKIKFLGCGGAFDHRLLNSSAIFQNHGFNFLIDCGSNIYGRIVDLNLVEQIDYVLLTHLHADHVGSLFTLIMHNFNLFDPKRKTKLIYPTESFKNDIESYFKHSLITPEKYIDFIPISQFVEIKFIETTNKHVEGLMSFAYFFEEGNEIIFYSGDLGDISVIKNFLKLFEGKKITVFHSTCYNKIKAHVYYKDLLLALKDREFFLYHVDYENPPEANLPLVGLNDNLLF